jgi:hypothetical protein
MRKIWTGLEDLEVISKWTVVEARIYVIDGGMCGVRRDPTTFMEWMKEEESTKRWSHETGKEEPRGVYGAKEERRKDLL